MKKLNWAKGASWMIAGTCVASSLVLSMDGHRSLKSLLQVPKPVTLAGDSAQTRMVKSFVANALAIQVPDFGIMPSYAGGEEGGGGGGAGDASCNALHDDAREACNTIWSTGYQHGALKYSMGTFCYLNREGGAQIEGILCHFRKSMGISLSTDVVLPITIQKTFGGMSVSLVVESPTEDFAVAAGYTYKGTVTIDNVTYMKLYFAGADDKTKGYLIEGARGFPGDDRKRVNYAAWDRTNSDAETFELLQCGFGDAGPLGSTSGGHNGDRCLFGKASYNGTSKAISTQVVLIEKQRSGGDSSSFGCFKMFASGTKGGTMQVAKTQNSLGGTGHALTSTATNATEMDGVELTDSATTANGTGTTLTGGQLSTLVNFDKSCNDVYVLKNGGELFATQGGDYIDFTKGPDEVF